MPDSGSDVTLLLARVREGNAEAAEQLVPMIYNQLRRIAAAYMRRQRPNHTLNATALVQEAYMRLVGPPEVHWHRLEDVLALDEILERLAQIDPRQGRVVELRFFGGLAVEETAEVMGVSPKTIKREWRSAKAWLHCELASGKTG